MDLAVQPLRLHRRLRVHLFRGRRSVLPIKIKAAILVKNQASLEIAEIESPERLGYGQVLVKVEYSGICGAQINEIEGAKGPEKFLPHLLGHEGCATVLETGEGVKTVKKGDKVVMHWRPSNAIQSQTPSYR